jgi:glycosyltransferase involved in cell wall biosynthesis
MPAATPQHDATAVTPRVTVIIATYNWSSVLPYSIGSVLRQTFTDFELLVVGDGCTDDSEAVVRSIGDARVRWINLPQNSRHQSAPNNEGLRQARGELIAYLGHDDLWLPHHLELSVAALDRDRESDAAFCLTMNVAPGGAFTWPTVPNPAAGMYGSPLAIVHRRAMTERIGGWRDYRQLTMPPDSELWQRAARAGSRFTFVPRLTGVKLPASIRKNVYATRPSDEQALWAARIESQPDFEFQHMAMFAVGHAVPNGVPYGVLLRLVLRQTMARLRMRMAGALRWPARSGRTTIDAIRRFKGL